MTLRLQFPRVYMRLKKKGFPYVKYFVGMVTEISRSIQYNRGQLYFARTKVTHFSIDMVTQLTRHSRGGAGVAAI